MSECCFVLIDIPIYRKSQDSTADEASLSFLTKLGKSFSFWETKQGVRDRHPVMDKTHLPFQAQNRNLLEMAGEVGGGG